MGFLYDRVHLGSVANATLRQWRKEGLAGDRHNLPLKMFACYVVEKPKGCAKTSLLSVYHKNLVLPSNKCVSNAWTQRRASGTVPSENPRSVHAALRGWSLAMPTSQLSWTRQCTKGQP